MSLTVVTDNSKRVITIVGVSALIATVVASGNSALDATIAVVGILVSMIVMIWGLPWAIRTGVFTRSGAAADRAARGG